MVNCRKPAGLTHEQKMAAAMHAALVQIVNIAGLQHQEKKEQLKEISDLALAPLIMIQDAEEADRIATEGENNG